MNAPSAHYSLDTSLATGETVQVEEAIAAAKVLGQKYVILPYLQEQFRNSAKTSLNEYILDAADLNDTELFKHSAAYRDSMDSYLYNFNLERQFKYRSSEYESRYL